jgi:hypothetical protein
MQTPKDFVLPISPEYKGENCGFVTNEHCKSYLEVA